MISPLKMVISNSRGPEATNFSPATVTLAQIFGQAQLHESKQWLGGFLHPSEKPNKSPWFKAVNKPWIEMGYQSQGA